MSRVVHTNVIQGADGQPIVIQGAFPLGMMGLTETPTLAMKVGALRSVDVLKMVRAHAKGDTDGVPYCKCGGCAARMARSLDSGTDIMSVHCIRVPTEVAVAAVVREPKMLLSMRPEEGEDIGITYVVVTAADRELTLVTTPADVLETAARRGEGNDLPEELPLSELVDRLVFTVIDELRECLSDGRASLVRSDELAGG